MDDPIQVTLLKIQPRYSQTSCENATPSSDTSPLASRRSPRNPRYTDEHNPEAQSSKLMYRDITNKCQCDKR